MAAVDAEADSNIGATVKRLKEMKLEVKTEKVEPKKEEDEGSEASAVKTEVGTEDIAPKVEEVATGNDAESATNASASAAESAATRVKQEGHTG
eukprot:8201299-Karenia_brevis.AAC.1